MPDTSSAGTTCWHDDDPEECAHCLAAQLAHAEGCYEREKARAKELAAALHWIDARTIAPHEPKVNLYGFAVWADGALGEISTKAKAALKDDGGE